MINNGTSDYANAYFEINYVKVFSLGEAVDPSGTPVSSSGSASTATNSSSGAGSVAVNGFAALIAAAFGVTLL